MRGVIRRLLDGQLRVTEEGRPLAWLRPVVEAVDNFCFESPVQTSGAPHIRDAVDVKRWMTIVVIALIPCIFMAIWNTGLQKFVFGSYSPQIMGEYVGIHSLTAYLDFVAKDGRWMTVLWYGLRAFLPVMMISYIVGGACEAIFACLRKTEIAEGLLVSGMLYALILPPTIPYWMVAFGVASGIILSKELFGGTGMNIVNPALCCRIILFFAFPAQMTGDVWVGTNTTAVRQSIIEANKLGGRGSLDGFTQATPLARANVGLDIKQLHVDAIAAHFPGVGSSVRSWGDIAPAYKEWAAAKGITASYAQLSEDQLRGFVTDTLHLSPENFETVWRFAELEYGKGPLTNWNFFLGNRAGSMGETSVFACLLGALVLIMTGVGSWRTMCGVLFGVFGAGILMNGASDWYGSTSSAVFGMPVLKHLLLGGLAFGTVFMATDPVSSPCLRLSRWIYGILIGCLTMIIRTINPAYPEGVMLSIIIGNVVAPLIDHFVAKWYRRGRLTYRLSFSDLWTVGFIIILSTVCAFTLSLLASALKAKKFEAKELDRSEQLLSAAKVFSLDGHFLVYKGGEYIPAQVVGKGELVPGDAKAEPEQVMEVYRRLVRPGIVTKDGKLMTYREAGLNMDRYLAECKSTKPSQLKWLPLYSILPSDGKGPPESYVIPVSGFGLWDKIAGYIAIKPDGKTVVGISWYDQKETPGLGGTISEPWWQKQFTNKIIFQPSESGAIDMAKSPIGILVVKGTVADVLGSSKKAMNAVDGMAGATLTGNGVIKAYKDSLEPYRSFFEQLAKGE